MANEKKSRRYITVYLTEDQVAEIEDWAWCLRQRETSPLVRSVVLDALEEWRKIRPEISSFHPKNTGRSNSNEV